MSLSPKESCGRHGYQEDHKQERISATEKQGRGCPESEQYQEGHEDDDDEEETKTIEFAFPELGDFCRPPFCSNRFGVGGRSFRRIRYTAQSPYQRHRPYSHSRTSASRNQNEALPVGEQDEQYEQAKRDSQDHAAGSSSLVVPMNNAKKKEVEGLGVPCFSQVRRNLSPRKRVFHPDETIRPCRESLSAEDSLQGHKVTGPDHAAPKADQKVKNAGNFETKNARCSHDTSREKRSLREREELEDMRYSEDSAVEGVFHPSLGCDDLQRLKGILAPSVAVPNISFLAVTGSDSLQPSGPSAIGAGGTLGLAPAGEIPSTTPAGPATALLTLALESSFLVSGVASNPMLVTACQKLAPAEPVTSLSLSCLGGGSYWKHSVSNPSSPLMPPATIPTATNQNSADALQQQLQDIHIIAASSQFTNTNPVVANRTHPRHLPGITPADLVAAATAPHHLLKHDKHRIPLYHPIVGQRTSASPSFNHMPRTITSQEEGQHRHDRRAPPATRSTSSSPIKDHMPAEDGSRVDPEENDYLGGQGGHGVHHIGNKRVRDHIESLMPEYWESKQQSSSTPHAPHTESVRSKLVRTVIQDVRNRGGTFLQRDVTGTKWVPLPDRDVVRKITQRFNEEACGRAQLHKSKKLKTS